MDAPDITCILAGCERRLLSKGYCAKHYFRFRQGRPLETECAQCGTKTERPRYCSQRCSQIARARRNGVVSWDERYPEPKCKTKRDCVVCGQTFQRKAEGRDSGLCCSRDCGFTLLKWRGERARLFREAKDQFAQWARRAKRTPLAPKIRNCRDCDQPAPKCKHRCLICQAKQKTVTRAKTRQRPSYRAAKARRKAIERGMVQGAERFDPIEILSRDGWRCHICGCLTPKRLRGTYHDRAPEVDHIVPLSLGGSHTRINTACSCRKCNHSKGATIKGQLRLVA